MMTNIFDKIASSKPINKSTALSNSGGYSYKRQTNSRDTYAAPLKVRPLPNDATNLEGIKKGKLTVIGIADIPKPKKAAAKWLVKCQCGNYEIRSASALRNAKNVGDCCQDCWQTINLKKIDWERQFGIEIAHKLKNQELANIEKNTTNMQRK